TSGAGVEELPITRIAHSIRRSPFIRYQPGLLAATALVAGAVWPQLPYFHTSGNEFLLSLVLIYALLGVALTMLLGWGGQVSLGNFALVGLGAYLIARWASDWTLLAVVLVVGAIGAGVMVLVGLPALRIRGLTLAVTTLGLAVISQDWLYHQSWIGGANPLARTVPALSLGGGLGSSDSQMAAYYVALVVLALT